MKAEATEDIVGPQAPAPWIAEQASGLLRQRGHAWLLHGPSGLGQYDLALELARAWLCEASPGEQRADGRACGHCASCHAVDVRTHADLRVLMPETAMLALGWPLDEKAQSDLDDKKRKPSREIRVEAMRDAIEFAQRTDARGRGKVVLIYPAERMNHVTANALLKTLEEPVGQVRFVLASEAQHLLLPTIRSRCLGHAMRWPMEQAARDWLLAQGVAPADAGFWLQAAGTRPAAALQLARSGWTPARWSAVPKAMARGDTAAVEDLAPPQLVDLLQKLCHDLTVRAAGGHPRFFAPADLDAVPRRPAADPRLGAWWRDLVREARQVEHPFHAGLMVEALVSRARQALN